MVIGITGGIGSGKSLVSQEFCRHRNTVYYHADEEAKKLMNNSASIREQIQREFGKESYKNDILNREYIASIVFKNPTSLHTLNAIVHPIVREHFRDFINKQEDHVLIIYENAILFEIQSDQVCDFIITVNAPMETRIKRVVKRDHISREAVLDRMKNQWPDAKKNMLSNYIVLNLEKEETLLKVQNIHNILTKKLPLF